MTKIGLRNAWFQAHKWIGLVLAILIIPICLTGSALVWHDGLQRSLTPERYAISGAETVAPARYVEAARAALPGDARIVSVRLPEDPADPAVVSASPGAAPAQSGPPARLNVYVDPPTAKVLAVANSRAGLFMVMHVLHGSLMVPGVGRAVVGWIGVAMLISAVSGLWLWWPTVGNWARGLRWRRHRNLDTNLHHLFGFWIALPLFILSLTGAWISFPGFFGSLVGETASRPGGPGGAPKGPDRAAMMRAKPLERPATPLDAALARAQALAAGEVRQVTFPTDVKPEWAVQIAGKGKPVTVTIDDARGLPELAKGGDPRAASPVARWMRRIHDGTDMGIVWQVIIFVGGIVPAGLAVTGVIMWWRARGWKAELKARKRRMKVAPAE